MGALDLVELFYIVFVATMESISLQPTVSLCRHCANNSIDQEHLATSPLLVTRFHLPQAIVVRLHANEVDVAIITPETAGSVGGLVVA